MKFVTTFVALFSLFAGLISCSSHEGQFSILNRSTDQIERVSVTVCNQTIEIQKVEPGRSVTGKYKVTSDSHFVVLIQFSSGRTLSKEGGYVTNGMDFKHEIVVMDTDVEIRATAPYK